MRGLMQSSAAISPFSFPEVAAKPGGNAQDSSTFESSSIRPFGDTRFHLEMGIIVFLMASLVI